MKYRLHRAVISEYFDNIVFYENRLPGLGADYLNEFETVIAHICTTPNFYPTIAAPDIHKAGLRRFPFHVIYRVMLASLLNAQARGLEQTIAQNVAGILEA